MSRGKRNQWRRRLRRRWKHQPGLVPWLLALPQRAVMAVFRVLPRGLALGSVERAGRLIWFSSKRRRIARDHLALALPARGAAERDRIARLSCGRMARNLAEGLLLSHRIAPARALELVEFEPGARELLEGMAGKGAVFVEGHFGAIEAMAAVLGLLGLDCAVPMRFPTNYYLGRDLVRAREGWGVELLHRKGSVRKMQKYLEQGRSVLLISDQNAHHRPIFVPWFGKPAASERGAAFLSVRLGRPLLVCWCLPEGSGFRWRVGCKQVMEAAPPREEPAEEDLVEATARAHAALEEVIRRDPDQYLWIHDRYRTRPPQERAAPEPATQARA